MNLPPSRERVLLVLHDRLSAGGIDYQLGGSGMMALRGIDVDVYDLDLVFPTSARDDLPEALREWWHGFVDMSHPDFASDWFAQITVGKVPIDLVGGFTIRGEPPLPFENGGETLVGGVEIPLAPVDQWIRIYERYDSEKARLLGQLAGGR